MEVCVVTLASLALYAVLSRYEAVNGLGPVGGFLGLMLVMISLLVGLYQLLEPVQEWLVFTAIVATAMLCLALAVPAAAQEDEEDGRGARLGVGRSVGLRRVGA